LGKLSSEIKIIKNYLLDIILMRNLFSLLFIFALFILSCTTANNPTYQLTTTVSPTEGGTIGPSSGVYAQGEMVTLTATPSTGWRFVRWEGDWSSNQNPSSLTMTKDYSVVGIFEKRNYPLTINIEGYGEVEERVIQQKTTEYPYQTVVELTPVPDEGWRFVEWSGDLSGSEVPKQIIVDGDKTVTAKFERKDYPLTINVVGEGTVKETVLPQRTIQYPFETAVVLESIPSEGWEFLSWSGDLNGEENPQLIVVDGDKTVTATFQLKTYPVTITTVGEGSVGVDPLLDEYPHGSRITLTAIPEPGWKLTSWSGDVSGTSSPVVVTITREMNITVTFTQIAYLSDNGITIQCPNGSVGEIGIVNGVEYEVVDRNRLNQRRDEGKDLTKVCTSLVTDMSGLFQDRAFNQPIGNWDVSKVTNMGGLFWNSTFNQIIDKWDVMNVSNMAYMFAGTPFNQSIGSWDTSGLLNARGLFQGSLFNQPLGNWNVSNVRNMFAMFAGTPFNQSIGSWDVGNVSDMEQMFSDTPFNQNIEDWNVSRVTTMRLMFYKSLFNQPIGNWNVSSVRNMSDIFSLSSFNQPIGSWDVSNVTNMGGMFFNTPFNQPIGNWNVGNVTDMRLMFHSSPFNQPIGNWNVGNVRNMYEMFQFGSFNQPIGNWNVSSVTDMRYMFDRNRQFNQDISGWCVSQIPDKPVQFDADTPQWVLPKPIWGTCPVK
jgi:surface protein